VKLFKIEYLDNVEFVIARDSDSEGNIRNTWRGEFNHSGYIPYSVFKNTFIYGTLSEVKTIEDVEDYVNYRPYFSYGFLDDEKDDYAHWTISYFLERVKS
jgi:hypothetical protein